MKPIPGYEQYSITENGQVYSSKCNRYLRPKTDKYGYKAVSLSKNGKPKHFTVHRLVATAFVPNPCGYSCVNHINELKTDNRSSNLEWCTVKYNDNYGNRNLRISKTKSKNPVVRILPNGKEQSFLGVKDAFRKTGVAHSQVSRYCKDPNNKEWRFLHERDQMVRGE